MNTSKNIFTALATLLILGAFSQTLAESAYWTFNGTGNYSDTANWSLNADGTGGSPTTAPAATETATFTSSNNNDPVTANLTAATAIGGLVFTNTGTTGIRTDSVANYAITLGSGGLTIDAAAGAVTFGLTVATDRIPFTLAANQTWTNNSTNLLSLNNQNTIATGGFLLTVDGSGNITEAAVISGTGGIVKNGTGNLTLSAVNTFTTGGIVLNSGTLRLGNNAGLGGAASVLTINGGSIDVTAARTTTNNNAQNWNGDFTYLGSNTWDTGTGAVTLGGNRTVTVNDSVMTVGGAIDDGANTFSLTVAGATEGILRLNGNNTYGGGTTVPAGGILSIGSTAALPGWNSNGAWSAAANGTLAVQNAVVDADITTLLGTTNFADGARFGFDTAAGGRTYNTVITDTAQGVLGLAKLGANELILGGDNSYSGGTLVINNGGVRATHNNAFGTGPITILNTGGFSGSGVTVVLPNDIIFNNPNPVANNALSSSTTFAGNVTGTGVFNFNGFTTGTFGFTGNNTGWSGDITSTGGAQMRLGHVNALGTGTFSFGNDITGLGLPSMSSSVDLSGSNGVANDIINNLGGTVFYLDNPLKLSGIISGPGSLRLGTGSTAPLYLTGNNTYTGFTNLQDGTLSVANIGNGGESRNIGAASNAAINIVFSNGTLQYTGAGESTDRLFTIGSAAASYLTSGAPTVDLNATVTARIDASGSGPLVFANTGNLTVGSALNNVLHLTGSNTGNNTLAAVIADSTDSSAVVLPNCTTTNQTNGAPNRQIIVPDSTGILVGDTVTGTGINGTTTVTAVLGPTRVAMNPGSNLTQTDNATLTFTNPDVSLNKTHLLKSGNGTWVLTAANTFTGNTTINGGGLAVLADSGLGTAPASPTPGHLNLNDGALATVLTMTLNANRGVAVGGSQGGQFYVFPATTLSYGGIIAGSGGLELDGGGTLNLSGNNTYAGTTLVTSGILSLSAGDAIPDANTLIITGGVVDLSANETVGVLILGNATQGNNTYGSTASAAAIQNDTYFSGNAILTVGDGGGITFTSWAAGYGLNGSLTDNFDSDKFTDGEEYAFDLDPTTDELGNVLASQTSLSNGNVTLTLAFSGNSAKSDINYVVRRANNPGFTANTVVGHWNGTANWTTSNATYFGNETQAGAGDVKAINVNLNIPAASEPRQFLKVDIE